MRSTFALLALAAGAFARPQGITAEIAPTATAPAGCSPTYPGTFEITVVNVTTSKKRDLVQRQKSGILTLSLDGGVLHDQAGRTGYIAANYQFQFDEPPQTGAIYTSGFSVCGNGSLALGGSAIFYQCESGSFFNLYDRSWAAQCTPIYIVAEGGAPVAASQSSDGQVVASTEVPLVTQKTDGQPGASSALSAPVSQITDGQPQFVPVSVLSDGQPQAPTGAPVSQLTDGQPQAPTGVPVSVKSDGQPIATAAPVSQISDGQLQAPTSVPVATASPVSELTDGQPQAPTGAPVSQISDGQPQITGAPVSVKSDGQPIATVAPTLTSAVAPVSQISDGQIQATANGTVSLTASPSQFTGAAASPIYNLGAMAAGLLGVAAML